MLLLLHLLLLDGLLFAHLYVDALHPLCAVGSLPAVRARHRGADLEVCKGGQRGAIGISSFIHPVVQLIRFMWTAPAQDSIEQEKYMEG